MATRAEFFALLGRVSIYFSTLEADLAEVLCSLAVHGSDQEGCALGIEAVVATLIEGNDFKRKTVLLEKIAEFHDERLKARVHRLLKAVEPLRKRRNLFIHGKWELSPESLEKGVVTVSETKVCYKRGAHRRSWSSGVRHRLSINELRKYETELMRALKLVAELQAGLGSWGGYAIGTATLETPNSEK